MGTRFQRLAERKCAPGCDLRDTRSDKGFHLPTAAAASPRPAIAQDSTRLEIRQSKLRDSSVQLLPNESRAVARGTHPNHIQGL